MKIVDVRIERWLSGDARIVTVGLAATDAEALEGMSPEVDTMVLSAFARALGSASVLMPEQGANPQRANEDAVIAKAQAEAMPEPAKRGRRRANPLGETTDAPAGETSVASPEPSPPTTAQAAPAEAAPRRRRPSPTSATTAAEPSSGTSATIATPPEPATRRRRAADPIQSPATTVSLSTDDKITDMDLGKAASQAAVTLTPIVVQGILKDEFKVPHVGKLEGANRRKFLDTLAARVKAGR